MAGPRILLVYPAEARDRLMDHFEAAGCTVETVSTATTAIERIVTDQFDCLVSKRELPGDDGLTLQSAVEQVAPDLPFVLFTDDTIETELDDIDRFHVVRNNGEGSLDRLVEAATTHRSTEPSGPKQDISGHEPTTEEIARAIEEAPIGISLSDPSLSDYPLVYTNDAWGSVTGYETEEVLGRNPRLLQGPQSDGETVEQLSAAIENEEPVNVEIRNYKRDGTPFWNDLTVAPVFDDDELTHYVGFQIDVSDRREAEALAEERARKLDDQRSALRRVLERVNGLLSEVSGILVESTDSETIAHQVCDAVATEPGYAAGWIGTVTPGETTLQLSATSELPTDTPSEIAVESLPAAVQRAIETDELQWSTGSSGDSPLDPARVGARGFLVVPLCYGNRRYGLLGVYGTDTEVLDRREQQVFASLGRMIANGLHAVEATRLLTTDHVVHLEIEIRDEAFALSRIAAAIDGTVEREGTTRTDTGDCELYLSTGRRVDIETVTALRSVSAGRIVSETDTETTLAVQLSEALLDEKLADIGAVITETTATDQAAQLTVETAPQQDVRSLLDTLRADYETVELRARTERDRRECRPDEFAAAVDERLTDRQRAALEAAQLNGYFEWPRPVDGEAIAETMGITRQTFHQHLRAAEQKLVEAYVEAA